MADRFLFISDTQIPFEAPRALEFCKAVQKEFRVPAENVYHVGDEVDLYHGSGYKKSPDAALTANQEIDLARERLKAWYRAFPQMKLATSNHGQRYVKKALEAEIPSQVLKCYRTLLDAPKGWQWRHGWNIRGSRAHMLMIHGVGYSGAQGHRNAAIDAGMNVIIGHLHSHAGIVKINTEGRKIWGMNVGSLIDVDAFAFSYGQFMRHKPVLTVGVVLDGGLTPILIPYERF